MLQRTPAREPDRRVRRLLWTVVVVVVVVLVVRYGGHVNWQSQRGR